MGGVPREQVQPSRWGAESDDPWANAFIGESE